MFIMRDFYCPSCEMKFEALILATEDCAHCKDCGTISDMTISAPMIGTMNDPVKRKETLLKRSHDHSVKERLHDYDKFGMKSDGKKRWAVPTTRKPKKIK